MKHPIKTTETIFPMPVLMMSTYSENGSINVMNTVWGTMPDCNRVVLNLTETHRMVENTEETPDDVE